jgi:hypothetical protein
MLVAWFFTFVYLGMAIQNKTVVETSQKCYICTVLAVI